MRTVIIGNRYKTLAFGIEQRRFEEHISLGIVMQAQVIDEVVGRKYSQPSKSLRRRSIECAVKFEPFVVQ